MTIILVASEIIRGVDNSRRFKFDLDDGKKFCYRSRVSCNYFFSGPNQYNWKGGKTLQTYQALYHRQDIREFEMHLKIFQNSLGDKPLPEGYDTLLELPNLWEFYKAIGWDYKTKKWSK